jgi:hypothetical protein
MCLVSIGHRPTHIYVAAGLAMKFTVRQNLNTHQKSPPPSSTNHLRDKDLGIDLVRSDCRTICWALPDTFRLLGGWLEAVLSVAPIILLEKGLLSNRDVEM